MTDMSTMIAATDRSIPAVMIISDCAAARMPMMDTCCMIRLRLNGEKNLPPAMAQKTSTLRARTMTGTSVGLLCSMCCKRCSGV